MSDQTDTQRLTTEEVEDLLVHLLRCNQVFVEAQRLLKPEFFDMAAEPHYATLWVARCDLHERYPGGIPRLAIFREIQRRIDANPAALTDSQADELLREAEDAADGGFIQWAYAKPADDINPNYGRDVLQRFLRERSVIEPLRRSFAAAGDEHPYDFETVLDNALRQRQLISAVQEDPVVPAFMANQHAPTIELFPTGTQVIDDWIGGQAGGVVYGFLAPYGVGKTTLLAHMADTTSAYFFCEHIANQAPLKHVYFVTYEESAPLIRTRLLAAAAAIKKDRLEEMTDPEAGLSREPMSQKYEVEYFRHTELLRQEFARRSGQAAPPPLDRTNIPSEYTRYMAAAKRLSANVHIIDFSKDTGVGGGWIDEISAQIGRCRDQFGWEPGWIGIDHVLDMANRHCDDRELDRDRQLRHLIRDFGTTARRKLAEKFDVPVWALHQFAGAATGFGVGKVMHHSMAAESKAFGQGLFFCFCMGNVTTDGVGLLTCSKGRLKNVANQHRLVRVDGGLQRVWSADVDYAFDPATRRVERKEAMEIGGARLRELNQTKQRKPVRDDLDPELQDIR